MPPKTPPSNHKNLDKVSHSSSLFEFSERFRYPLDNLIEGCQIIDYEWRYVYLNPAALRHAKRDLSQLLGKTMQESYPDIENTPLFQVLQDVMVNRVCRRYINHFTYPDHSQGWFELNIEPIPEGIFILSLDITEQMKVRELEEAKKVAEEANRAKTYFLRNISHELRAPLSLIIGFSEVLIQNLQPLIDNENMGAIHGILEAGLHLKGLIDDLLDLSRIEAGKFELKKTPIDVANLIGKSVNLFREKAHKQRMEIQLDLPSNLGIIYADERRIKQVMLNLMDNAMKYTHDGGTIGVKARDNGQEVEVTIWDTGVGISPQDLPKLFQPFQRINNEMTNKVAGTGLGLNFSKKLVELHGGHIWVKSATQMGSQFSFALPKTME